MKNAKPNLSVLLKSLLSLLTYLLIFSSLYSPLYAQQWKEEIVEFGADAVPIGDTWYTTMSDDGLTFATSEIFESPNRVRVYQWNGEIWVKKGVDFTGADFYGFSINLSADGHTLAIGKPLLGQIEVYTWNGSNWQAKGAHIKSEMELDGSGWSVDLSNDGHTIAFGAPLSNANGEEAGLTQVFSWDAADSTWIQQGQDIIGEAAQNWSGVSVKLNGVGDVLAIGAAQNKEVDNNSGHVRIYAWDGANWMQKGRDINGKKAHSYLGVSLDLSEDGHTVVISALDDTNTQKRTLIRVYTWVNNTWQQKGADIIGETDEQDKWDLVFMRSTSTVAISADGNRVLFGDYRFPINRERSGYVDFYAWNEQGMWEKKGQSIYGTSGDDLGWSVSLNAAGDRFVVGMNNHFQVYSWSDEILHLNPSSDIVITAYPNPTQGNLSINMGQVYPEIQITISNLLGQVISQQSFSASEKINMHISGPSGYYFIRIQTSDGDNTVLRVLKEG